VPPPSVGGASKGLHDKFNLVFMSFLISVCARKAIFPATEDSWQPEMFLL